MGTFRDFYEGSPVQSYGVKIEYGSKITDKT
jgi:hypothetical protein